MSAEKKEKYSINANYIVGCRFDNWLRMLWQNKFRVKPSSIPTAIYITLVSFVMFIPACIEKLIYGKRIKNTKIENAPVYILGHWRSGTTYLFNVMAKDEQFAFFDAVSVFTHNNFLLMEKILRPTLAKSMPDKRPMDNIAYTTYVPQEELYAFGSQIPECIIHMTAFPHNHNHYRDMAFKKCMTDKEYNRFCRAYMGILKKLTFAKKGKALLLKSPDNTARMGVIDELLPNSKFIHIYRDPYKVIVSTIGLFKKMFPMFALQSFPDDDYVENFIVDLYERLYTQYIEDKKNIPSERLVEIRYEDFVKAPIETLSEIYQKLDIEGFEEAKPRFEAYIESLGDYQTNKFELSERLKNKINTKLSYFVDYFGYERME